MQQSVQLTEAGSSSTIESLGSGAGWRRHSVCQHEAAHPRIIRPTTTLPRQSSPVFCPTASLCTIRARALIFARSKSKVANFRYHGRILKEFRLETHINSCENFYQLTDGPFNVPVQKDFKKLRTLCPYCLDVTEQAVHAQPTYNISKSYSFRTTEGV